MPKRSRQLVVRIVNFWMERLLKLGLVPGPTFLLTTVGRKSGLSRSTPVTLVIEGKDRWLVSPYGSVGWVHNLRSSGKAEIRKGKKREEVSVTELAPDSAAPVLKEYLKNNPITRPFFEASSGSPIEEFANEAHRHPVFKIN